MRILFVSSWFPYPPDNGSRIRAYNLIKALAREHEVYLISLTQEDSIRENAVGLASICNIVSLHESRWFRPGTLRSALGYFSTRPRSAVDTFDPKIRLAVKHAVELLRPNAIVASTLGVVEYIPHDMGVPTILEEHNCEYAVLRRAMGNANSFLSRLYAEARWRKFARWEAGICRKYGAVVMVSDSDKELMLEAAPALDNLHVVPNGVDTEHYTPAIRNPQKDLLLYNGAPTYGANLDAVRYFASNIYPLLAHDYPGIKLRVTGRINGVDLGEVAGCPGVEFTGYVDDIRAELSNAAACVVTLRQGGGSRLKILEAMAAGVPVISTSVGIEGIDVENGRHAMVADTPVDIAEIIRHVLGSGELQASLSANARSLVEERYSWSAIVGNFVKIVEDTCSRNSASSVKGETVERL